MSNRFEGGMKIDKSGSERAENETEHSIIFKPSTQTRLYLITWEQDHHLNNNQRFN